MIYITQEGETLLSVALNATGVPEYAQAIAHANNLSTDFYETPVNVALEPGIALEIPDAWTKPRTSITIIGSGDQARFHFGLAALIVVAVALVLRT